MIWELFVFPLVAAAITMAARLVRLYLAMHLLGVAYVLVVRPQIQGFWLQIAAVAVHIYGAGLAGRGHLRKSALVCLLDAGTLGLQGSIGWLLSLLDLAQVVCLLVFNLDEG